MNSTIFKKVITKKDYNTFYDLLIPSWLEMGYPLECVLGNVSRYIVFSEEMYPVGNG